MEQKSIVFRGVSRAASDVKMADGVCSESVNVILENNELMPIIPPEVVSDFPIGFSYKIVYCHKTNSYEHWIGIKDGYLIWINKDTTATSEGFMRLTSDFVTVKAIGNILIVAMKKSMMYVLYSQETGSYIELGSCIPEPKIELIQRGGAGYPAEDITPDTMVDVVDQLVKIDPLYEIGDKDNVLDLVRKGANRDKIIYAGEPGYASTSENEKKINNAYSLISEAIWADVSVMYGAQLANDIIPYPIFLRYAIKLYDGTYTRHSVPILISSSNFTKPTIFDKIRITGSENNCIATARYKDSGNISEGVKLSFKIYNMHELEKWKDVIQGIDFFFSEPIYTTPFGNKILNVENITSTTDPQELYVSECEIKQYTTEEYEQELLKKSSLFYLIKSHLLSDLKDMEEYKFEKFADKMGDVLPTQTQLTDGYNSNHCVSGQFLYEYNKRLNMSDIKQELCGGLCNIGSKIATDEEGKPQYWTGCEYTLIYHIKTESKIELIRQDINLGNIGKLQFDTDEIVPEFNVVKLGHWLAYPDTRCFKVDIYREEIGTILEPKNQVFKATRKMKPHPFLNVAYCYNAGGYDDALASWSGVFPAPAVEEIGNKLYQSEVNNPFVFRASGIHTLPVGKIIGAMSATEAISQGQFGQYPLYIFTDDGVWSMDLDSTGKYLSMAPLSREVCNNTTSITGISGLVLFSTDKGLMMLQSGNITDISYDMRGKSSRLDSVDGSLPYLEEVMAREGMFLPYKISEDISFLDFLKDCFIAYDYLNYRLIIVNSKCDYQYVYSLTNNSWHKLCLNQKFVNTFNNYPECYLQGEDGLVYNFSAIDDIESYTDKVSGLVVTRAMTFDAPYIRKRIDDLRVRGEYDKGSVVRLLYGSYDSVHWTYINSLKGKSFPYYKIALVFRMLPKQRINSIDILFTPRWNNKLR